MVNCVFLSIIAYLSIYRLSIYISILHFGLCFLLATNHLLVSKDGYEFRIETSFFQTLKQQPT